MLLFCVEFIFEFSIALDIVEMHWQLQHVNKCDDYGKLLQQVCGVRRQWQVTNATSV
jgi:hypothetical protein